jgi:hypothetical protein
MKLEPPFVIDGRAVIRGKNGEEFVVESVRIAAVDKDGYVQMDPQVADTQANAAATPTRIGSIKAKNRDYEIYSAGNDYRVVIHGPPGSRVVIKLIKRQFLAHVFAKVAKRAEVQFNQLRKELPDVKDSLQLKAALAILETSKYIQCTREGKFSYYRKLKEWSLTLFQ